jgi:hypothetical protein
MAETVASVWAYGSRFGNGRVGGKKENGKDS